MVECCQLSSFMGNMLAVLFAARARARIPSVPIDPVKARQLSISFHVLQSRYRPASVALLKMSKDMHPSLPVALTAQTPT